MNTIEKIRITGLMNERCESDEMAFNRGFDSILALDLPVKFDSWANDDKGRSEAAKKAVADDNNSINDNKQLYQYWIDNIYKPE